MTDNIIALCDYEGDESTPNETPGNADLDQLRQEMKIALEYAMLNGQVDDIELLNRWMSLLGNARWDIEIEVENLKKQLFRFGVIDDSVFYENMGTPDGESWGENGLEDTD